MPEEHTETIFLEASHWELSGLLCFLKNCFITLSSGAQSRLVLPWPERGTIPVHFLL